MLMNVKYFIPVTRFATTFQAVIDALVNKGISYMLMDTVVLILMNVQVTSEATVMVIVLIPLVAIFVHIQRDIVIQTAFIRVQLAKTVVEAIVQKEHNV